MNKHQITALLAFLVFASFIAATLYSVYLFGWMVTVITFIALITLIVIILFVRNKIHFSHLVRKYGDEELATKIINRTLWQGQTAEQVLDSLGKPKDIDQKVLKTKTKEIWKYFPSGRRRYGLRITLDNGEVVGWDQKL